MAAEQPPPDQDRTEAFLLGMLFDKPITPRRAARLIAAATLSLTVLGSVAVRLFDKREFDNLSDSLWWAMQTVTTVGYGDIVPEQTGGRLVGAVLMLNGTALISVVTAAVTAMLIERGRQRHLARNEELHATVERIESRLEEIETAVRPSGAGPRDP
jgi:voltage-gated potassium channel